MNLVSFAARNVLRNRFRTTLTVLGGIVAITAFVLLRTVVSSWEIGIEECAKDRLATHHKLSFGRIPLPKNYIDIIRQVPGVKVATWMSRLGGKDPRFPNEFVPGLAVDPTSFLEVFDEVDVAPDEKTRWLEDKQGVLVGDALAKKLGYKVGDKVTLQGMDYEGDWQFTIDGIYAAKRKTVDRSQFVFHWDYLNDSIPEQLRDKIGWISTRIDDPSHGVEISKAVDKNFDHKDIRTVTMSERALSLNLLGMFSALLMAIDVVSIIILFIMLLILGNTIAMGVRERTNEYGMLRALGFTPGHIRFFIVGEALTIGVVTGVLGLAAAYPIVEMGLARWIEENVGAFFPYVHIDAKVATLAFILPVILGPAAAQIPARRAAKLSVTDALRRVF